MVSFDHPADATCRICFEEADNASELIAPCGCSGSQKFVHLRCLRLWQENVLASAPLQLRHLPGSDTRARTCNVCRRPYTFPPPPPSWGQMCTRLGTMISRRPMGPVGLLFAMWVAAPALMTVIVTFFLLHLQGLRIAVHPLQTGWGLSYGIVFLRHGAPIPGLGPGTLIRAADGLESQVFSEAVILLLAHSAGGATGVMLGNPADAVAQASVAHSSADSGLSITVFHGGPVGGPAENRWSFVEILIHTVDGVAGSQLLLPVSDLDKHPAVFIGGSKTAILETVKNRNNIRNEEKLARAQRRSGSNLDASAAEHFLHVYRGYAQWTRGQLEGELRAGVWQYGTASASDLHRSSYELWHRLGQRLEYFAQS
ncbi:hypothetical protein WJX84_004543 [Apatococcus fuscideae]|uniref:RING-CH-type domain-containing protein n=1 Tax=Apatococcus fuscideae TaxID=2026836 RepID=A0AAW1TGZ8_9CHLO